MTAETVFADDSIRQEDRHAAALKAAKVKEVPDGVTFDGGSSSAATGRWLAP
jgi:hypothetical protein